MKSSSLLKLLVASFTLSLVNLFGYQPLIDHSFDLYLTMYWSSMFTLNILLPLFLSTKFLVINAYPLEKRIRQPKIIIMVMIGREMMFYDLLIIGVFLLPSLIFIGQIKLSYFVLSILSFFSVSLLFNIILAGKKQIKVSELGIIYLLIVLLPATLLLPYHLMPNTFISSILVLMIIPLFLLIQTFDSSSRLYLKLLFKSFKTRLNLLLLVMMLTTSGLLLFIPVQFSLVDPTSLITTCATIIILIFFNIHYLDFYYFLQHQNYYQYISRIKLKSTQYLMNYNIALLTSVLMTGYYYLIDTVRDSSLHASTYFAVFIINVITLSISTKVKKEYSLAFQVIITLLLWRII